MTEHQDKLRASIHEARMSAPEVQEGATCAIGNCKNEATENWLPSVCALSEAGIEPDWVGICTAHDVALNQAYVRLLCGDKYERELVEYAERKLG